MTESFARSQTAVLLTLLAAVTIAVSIVWVNIGGPEKVVGSPAAAEAVVSGSSVGPATPPAVRSVAPAATEGSRAPSSGPVPGVSN